MPKSIFFVRVRPQSIARTVRNLRHVRKKLERDADEFAERESELLFDWTGRIVPYLTGDLYDARFRRRVKNGIWHVGYDIHRAPYAWEVHQIPNREHPVRGPHPDPKQDHYLSVPRDALAQTYPARAQVKFNSTLRQLVVAR